MESTRQMLQKLKLTVQYLDWQLAKQRNCIGALAAFVSNMWVACETHRYHDYRGDIWHHFLSSSSLLSSFSSSSLSYLSLLHANMSWRHTSRDMWRHDRCLFMLTKMGKCRAGINDSECLKISTLTQFLPCGVVCKRGILCCHNHSVFYPLSLETLL